MLAEGECAGLVEHHDVEGAGLFETTSIPDQQSAPRAEGRGDGDHERDRESERVRAGDHQHRHHPLDRERGGGADGEPDAEREGTRRERDDGEPEGGSIGQGLGPALGGLGLLHQPHDPGEHRVAPHAGDDHPQGSRFIDGATDDLVPGRLHDRAGLAGEHRFVHAPLPFPEPPVGRDPGTWADEEQIAGFERGDGDLFHDFRPTLSAHPFRRIRQELCEFGERPLRLGDRAHLDPVPEQHDGDEGRQLLPEGHPRKAERDRGTEAEGDRDGQGDQRHHPGQAVFQFPDGSLEKGPSTIPEDQRPERRRDPSRPRKGRRHVPQGPLQHVSPDEGGKGQEEGEPEPIAEHRDRVPGMPVVTFVSRPSGPLLMPSACGRCGMRWGSGGRCVVVVVHLHGRVSLAIPCSFQSA